MNIAIVGFATEGKVSLEYYRVRGHAITICDANPDTQVPDGVASQLGEMYLDNLDRFDVIVRTAGMHPRLILDKNPSVALKITTAVNEFLANSPTKNIIGITGTKGKGTTSTLTAKILEAAGHTVWLGGNIGRSPLEFIDQIEPDDWVVLELSSFQLIDLKHSPHIATCLMVVPEHLNWHEDYEEYIAAKQQLFIHQSESDIAIYYADNEDSESVADASMGRLVPYCSPPGAYVTNKNIVINDHLVCPVDGLKLLGQHNWQNACAAVTAVWQAGINNTVAIRSGLTSFSGLEHRLELVRKVDGVDYYDDSFGTTPETAIVALRAFSQPKVVVLGGSDKGASYDQLAHTVANSNVRHVIVIGDETAKISAALRAHGFTAMTIGITTMPEMVKAMHRIAQPGDVGLLSTGCASFGLFTDYKDRGNQFKAAVLALNEAA
ncbi:UDP-N-acetylmuramoyl-L-alanine--D-glutamate ligase [Candidatus Saccharibacteria bacterium]|nr:UDP-N-acetylmuramoyl-L-alanine--D-glutamate ligase [Candidatus Saccharibacteria bacterium]